jgi:hypothetical protein
MSDPDKEWKEPLGCLLWIVVFVVGFLVLSNWDAINNAFTHWLNAHGGG